MKIEVMTALENSREELIKTLSGSVRINSVQADPVTLPDGTYLPFGQGVEEAYRYMLNAGKELGFEVFDAGHYGGHIEWKVPGATETFGIAAHLDVVPEGTGWEHGPYSADIEDGRMYGRGTADDKGPLVASLYAMKALRDAGVTPKMNIRLILGLDEETGMIGMERYLEEAGVPDMGITPDAVFPVITGEKGIMVFQLAQKLQRQTGKDGLFLSKLTGGIAVNSVPGTARAVVKSQDTKVYDKLKDKVSAYAVETGYTISAKRSGNSLIVETVGKAAHGAHPEDGLNAVSILMDFLGNVSFAQEDVNDFIYFYNEHIGFHLNGEMIGCGFEDGESGKLIFNAGIAEINDEIASVTVNIRYPVTFTGEQVYAGIEESLSGTDIGLIKMRDEKPVYMDISDGFAAALLAAYQEETGDVTTKPVIMGGGTYAKKFRRMLAYGAAFPGDEDRMHQANEYIDLEQLMKAARIYADALYRVCCQ